MESSDLITIGDFHYENRNWRMMVVHQIKYDRLKNEWKIYRKDLSWCFKFNKTKGDLLASLLKKGFFLKVFFMHFSSEHL